MSNEKTDWWVGLFILLGAIALSFLALRAGNLSSFSFAPTYALSAKFDNIGGLKVRAPVKSAGVVVGRVASISLDEKTFQAVVTVQIEKNYRFPKDSSAKILTSGLLGEQYIGLEAGGDDANMLAQRLGDPHAKLRICRQHGLFKHGYMMTQIGAEAMSYT